LIIIGAKGFAKQLVEVFFQVEETEGLCFFDDVSNDISSTLYDIPVLRNMKEVEKAFEKDARFCLGIGQPALRKKLSDKFIAAGGQLTTVISPMAAVAEFAGEIGEGTILLTGCVVENDARIGKGVLVNTLAVVHHDVVVGDYAEIAPGAKLLGGCIVNEGAFIGANAVVLPKITVGANAIVGAGAVVTHDVPAGTTVAGCPAKPING
jgi:sugar O-acyltransferase (sialic acid O-acetyltransferase NeuD family)